MKKQRLYLVEDDPLVSELLQEFLKGIREIKFIGEARDGASAIESIRVLHPDIVILDLRLPETHGLEVLRIIHAELPHCAVIVFTGSVSEHNVHVSMRLGAVAFVEKAYGLTELLKALNATITGKRYLSPNLARLTEEPPL
jgi:two-component system response regulator DctR